MSLPLSYKGKNVTLFPFPPSRTYLWSLASSPRSAAPWRPGCCTPCGCSLAARLLHPVRLLPEGPAAAPRSAAPWRPGCGPRSAAPWRPCCCTPFGCSLAAWLLHPVRLPDTQCNSAYFVSTTTRLTPLKCVGSQDPGRAVVRMRWDV